MTKFAFTKGLVAAAVLGCGTASVTEAAAQSYPYPSRIQLPSGAFNPYQARRNVTIAPSALPNRRAPVQNVASSGRPVDVGPASGPTGSRINVRVNQNLGATPAILSFKSAVAYGLPARVHARLLGGGSSFYTPAPRQLCIQGAGTWQAELVLSDGRNLGVVGTFTPTNCP